jgi:hypothetical protein
MKFGFKLFIFLAAFYAVLTLVYWQMAKEPVGITALALSAGLALIIGYYFWFTSRRSGLLPEDNLTGEIADGAGELGFFSPHSWWPLPVAASATAVGLGLIIGWWLTLIAVGALLVSILGFVLQYERPSSSSH